MAAASASTAAAAAAPAEGSGGGAVGALRELLARDMGEAEALSLFERYASAGRLGGEALRALLGDLLEASGRGRVVPDEAVEAARAELQASAPEGDAPDEGISWVEWKTYCMFVQARPLEALRAACDAAVPPAALRHALSVRRVPAAATPELVRSVFGAPGRLAAVYLAAGEALVCYEEAEGAATGEMLDGTELVGSAVEVRALGAGDAFPSAAAAGGAGGAGGRRSPSRVARQLAKAVVGARALDERAGVSRTATQVASSVSRAAEEHKVSERLAGVGAALSEKTRELDERFALSDKGRQVTATVAAATEPIVASAPFQAASTFLSGMFAAVSTAVKDLGADTSAAIETEEAGARPAPAFEMGSVEENGDAHAGEAPVDSLD